jgi:hypothetical protein
MKYAKYKLIDSAYYSNIRKLKDGIFIEPDGMRYFKTFAEAKRALKRILKLQRDEYVSALKYTNKMKECDIEEN